MTFYALRLQNATDTAPRVRMGDALSLQHKGPLGARSGVRPDGGAVVSVVSGAMSVQVTPFLGWVDGGTSDAQSGYPVVLDATATLAIDPGDASQARTDTVAVVIKEDAFDGSGATTGDLVIIKGTPGAGAPALPATAMPLRDITVPAGASAGTGGLAPANLATDRRTYLAATGGIVSVASVTERDAMTVVASQAVYRRDTGALEVYNGTSWDSYIKNSDTGWVAFTTRVAGLVGHYRIRNGFASVRVIGTATIATGSNVSAANAGDLPAAARPVNDVWGGAYVGTVGIMCAAANGSVILRHNDAGTTSIAGTLTYPVG